MQALGIKDAWRVVQGLGLAPLLNVWGLWYLSLLGFLSPQLQNGHLLPSCKVAVGIIGADMPTPSCLGFFLSKGFCLSSLPG